MKKIILGAMLVCCTATVSFADANADIMARQAIMKAIGAAAKAGDFEAIAKAADPAISIPAFAINTSGQGDVKTTASDAIWTDFEKFEGLMGELFAKASAGDKAAFGTCKACHTDYRSK